MKRFIMVIAVVFTANLASAEVCAVFNAANIFERLDIRRDETSKLIWSKTTTTPDEHCLNLTGDAIGDQLPTHTVIAMPDEPLIGRGGRLGPKTNGKPTPVVVWSRTDGNDWELVYSLWDYSTSSWTTPGYVDRTDNLSDDTDPVLSEIDNQPHLVWLSSNPVRTDIYASDGIVVSIGPRKDISWGLPYLVSIGPTPNDPNSTTANTSSSSRVSVSAP